jgi:hypothetical protein
VELRYEHAQQDSWRYRATFVRRLTEHGPQAHDFSRGSRVVRGEAPTSP